MSGCLDELKKEGRDRPNRPAVSEAELADFLFAL